MVSISILLRQNRRNDRSGFVRLTNGIELVPLNGTRFTTPVQVLFNAGKVSEGFNIKKDVKSDLLSCLAPLPPIYRGKLQPIYSNDAVISISEIGV